MDDLLGFIDAVDQEIKVIIAEMEAAIKKQDASKKEPLQTRMDALLEGTLPIFRELVAAAPDNKETREARSKFAASIRALSETFEKLGKVAKPLAAPAAGGKRRKTRKQLKKRRRASRRGNRSMKE